MADDAAEVARLEGRLLVRDDIGFYVAKRGRRLVFDSVIKGLNDVLLEMFWARMRLHDCVPFGSAIFLISKTEHVHFNPGGYECDHRVHVLWNSRGRMQCDRGPHQVNFMLGNAVAAKEITGGIRSVNFKSFTGAAVLVSQSHVMEHRAGVKQLGIKAEAAVLASQ